jgi:hypothetical protein
VEAILNSTGAATSLTAGPPLIIPELAQSLSLVEQGQSEPSDVLGRIEGWEQALTGASDRIGELPADTRTLQEAKILMTRGLLLYRNLVGDVEVALELGNATGGRLLRNSAEQLLLAKDVFNSGWGALAEERRRFGLPEGPRPEVPNPPQLPGV